MTEKMKKETSNAAPQDDAALRDDDFTEQEEYIAASGKSWDDYLETPMRKLTEKPTGYDEWRAHHIGFESGFRYRDSLSGTSLYRDTAEPDTRRMMRFEAANAAMHALMRAEPDENELYTDRKKMDFYARYAVEYADALLDELDRTANRKKK